MYYGNRERLIDHNGIFNVDEAQRLVVEQDPEIFDYSIDGRDESVEAAQAEFETARATESKKIEEEQVS